MIIRELDRERIQARLMLKPLLQAEKDLAYHHQVTESHRIEGIIMKDVPGWKVGERPYNSDRFTKELFVLQ